MAQAPTTNAIAIISNSNPPRAHTSTHSNSFLIAKGAEVEREICLLRVQQVIGCSPDTTVAPVLLTAIVAKRKVTAPNESARRPEEEAVDDAPNEEKGSESSGHHATTQPGNIPFVYIQPTLLTSSTAQSFS
jgi:hypothetical protein